MGTGPYEETPIGSQTAGGQPRSGQMGGGPMGQMPSGGYGPPPYGYGGGGPFFTRRFGRPSLPVETKPFFLTSEFAVYLLMTLALVITAAADNSIDSWRFWLLETALTSAYMLSRGIAKSGTKSRAWDPRDDLLERARQGQTNTDG